MLGKKSIYRKPVVILASLVLLLLLNVLVVNNPIFATKVADLAGQTEMVADMTVEESNAQLAQVADSMVAEAAETVEATETTELAQVEPAANQQVVEAKDMSMKGQFKEGMKNFWLLTGFRNCKLGNLIMILVGIIFIFLAVK